MTTRINVGDDEPLEDGSYQVFLGSLVKKGTKYGRLCAVAVLRVRNRRGKNEKGARRRRGRRGRG